MQQAFDPDNPLALIGSETAKANAALNDFAALGPGRSISILHKKYAGSVSLLDAPPPTNSEQMLRRWSAAYAWQARCAAYDEKIKAQQREAREQTWLSRQEDEREQTWQVAQLLRQRALDMLKFPLATVSTDSEPRALHDGKTLIVERKIVKPAKWLMRDAAMLADVAAKLSRLSAELETERSVLTVEGLSTRDLEGLSTEQLQALKAQLEGAQR